MQGRPRPPTHTHTSLGRHPVVGADLSRDSASDLKSFALHEPPCSAGSSVQQHGGTGEMHSISGISHSRRALVFFSTQQF
eukprot:81782-Chlamydomonas_euryale.AAC.4